MAIGSGAGIDFFGTQDDIGNSSSAVASAAFSVTADLSQWTNDDDAKTIVATLRCQWATLPTDGSFIHLYARKMNVQSTNDSPKPSAQNTDQHVASFLVDGDVAINTNTFMASDDIFLSNHYTSQVYEFYIENQSGQTISAGWTLFVTPKADGPHA